MRDRSPPFPLTPHNSTLYDVDEVMVYCSAPSGHQEQYDRQPQRGQRNANAFYLQLPAHANDSKCESEDHTLNHVNRYFKQQPILHQTSQARAGVVIPDDRPHSHGDEAKEASHDSIFELMEAGEYFKDSNERGGSKYDQYLHSGAECYVSHQLTLPLIRGCTYGG